MRLKFARRFLVAAGVSVLLLFPNLGLGCGPFFEPVLFSPQDSPDTGAAFAAGNLGIVHQGMRVPFLALAYRYLNGLQLTQAQQDAAQKVWNHDVVPDHTDETEAIAAWNKACSRVQNIPAAAEISAFAPTADTYSQFLNCPGDAFNNAIHTMDDRMTKFGASSDAIREWISGQDQVFSNCAGGNSIVVPAVLTSGDPLLRADRNYQIAAAQLYGRQFDRAAAAFDAIAKDHNSPWSSTAAYLAARAMLRKATLAHTDKDPFDKAAMADAEQRLMRIVADSHAGSIKPMAQKMLNFVRFRTAPEKRVAELEQILLSKDGGQNFRQDFWDYSLLVDGGTNGGEMATWIETLRASADKRADAAHQALAMWNSKKSTPWLIAALMLAQPADAGVNDLLRAAAQVVADSPGYLTVRYHALALMIGQHQDAAARKELDALLNRPAPAVSVGAHNLFNDERQKLATSVDDFVAHAAEFPLVDKDDPDQNYMVADPVAKQDKAYFNPYITEILVKRLPVATLIDIAQSATLPKNLRREIARSAWVRAVLIDDFAGVTKVQTALQELDHPLWTTMADFRNAANDDDKRFAAIFVILNNPGMKPSVVEGELRVTTLGAIDDLRDNWWCADVGADVGGLNYSKAMSETATNFADKDAAFPYPSFVSDAQKAQAQTEWQKLSAVGTGPNYLASQVIAYAKSHPQDAHVPEALSLVVRATHYGCTDKDTTKFSKSAFDILHQKYPTSPWTAKTKYHY